MEETKELSGIEFGLHAKNSQPRWFLSPEEPSAVPEDTPSTQTIRKTKIIWTLSKHVSSTAEIEKLIENGMDVARISLVHSEDLPTQQKMADSLKEACAKKAKKCPLLIDLQGPAIKVKTLDDKPVAIKKGSKVLITTDKVVESSEETMLYCNCEPLAYFVKPGNKILIDRQKATLTVKEVVDQEDLSNIFCHVKTPKKSKDTSAVEKRSPLIEPDIEIVKRKSVYIPEEEKGEKHVVESSDEEVFSKIVIAASPSMAPVSHQKKLSEDIK